MNGVATDSGGTRFYKPGKDRDGNGDSLNKYISALREFEAAHRRWMSLSAFTPEGEAAKQYKDSCLARLCEARKEWESKKRQDDRRSG